MKENDSQVSRLPSAGKANPSEKDNVVVILKHNESKHEAVLYKLAKR